MDRKKCFIGIHIKTAEKREYAQALMVPIVVDEETSKQAGDAILASVAQLMEIAREESKE